MMFSTLFLVSLLLLKDVASDHKNYTGNFLQKSGYITVRPGAHLFWWLYFTTANVTSYIERPIIIWLQGGPGLSSSCTGNFLEIGPLDVNLNPRQHSWVQEFNVLFVDNPVGTGFSYVSNDRAKLATNNEDVTKDLLSFTQQFFEQNPEFQKVPLYVFGQSFGAKFSVELAVKIHEVQNIPVNLKGIASMGGYISPIDTLNHYKQLGLALGLLDHRKAARLNKITREIKQYINNNDSITANSLEMGMFRDIFAGCAIYNFAEKTVSFHDNMAQGDVDDWKNCNDLFDTNLLETMNSTTWTYHNIEVLEALLPSYYVPVTDKIEYLLNKTDLKMMVFTGMFDFTVNVAGTIAWLDSLKWPGAVQWKKVGQEIVEIDNIHEAFARKIDRLVLYIVTQAGHSIPVGNSKAMLEILRREILDDQFS